MNAARGKLPDINRVGATGLALFLAVALLASCGGEDTTTTVTETETTTQKAKTKTVTETTGTTTTTPTSNGETADLPTCDEGVYPCRNPDGSVSEGP